MRVNRRTPIDGKHVTDIIERTQARQQYTRKLSSTAGDDDLQAAKCGMTSAETTSIDSRAMSGITAPAPMPQRRLVTPAAR